MDCIYVFYPVAYQKNNTFTALTFLRTLCANMTYAHAEKYLLIGALFWELSEKTTEM